MHSVLHPRVDQKRLEVVDEEWMPAAGMPALLPSWQA
jgi:hypothetical protein